MANNYFRFRQFTINQDRCAMKVGTDGVLLGAWVDTGQAGRILDIGTGTGLIALMLAQRSQAFIEAVEIDGEAASQARENFLRSPWPERLESFHQPYQEFCKNGRRYDLVVSNPPYFSGSLLSPVHARSQARHNRSLEIDSMLEGISVQLNEEGRFGIIFPAGSFDSLIHVATTRGLFLTRMTEVIPAPGRSCKRILGEFSRRKLPLSTGQIIIEEHGRHQYSQAYKTLTGDFYL